MFALLAVLLAVLFSPSFTAGTVVFANDYSLGMLKAYADQFFTSFLGVWFDLNGLGRAMPASTPNVTQGLYFLLASPWSGPDGTVYFAKFYAPLAIVFLGLCAWIFFRALKFRPAVCAVAAVAAALHTDPFSNACWGLAPWPICHGLVFLALAALVTARGRQAILKLLLAGAATALGIMEAYDTGALFSLVIAAFTVFISLTREPFRARVLLKSGLNVAWVAGFALLVAAATVITLIGTEVKGVVGMGQDAESKARRWQDATHYSLPKQETLRILIPGLYGYRGDTPNGGFYWGGVGGPGQSGSGEYAGVLVVLLAGWAGVQSFRRTGSPYDATQKRHIWFWTGAALITLLLAYGKHAPFYRLFYLLPYASTIRNPIKFMQPFSVAIGILFAFGLEGFARTYLGAVIGAAKPAKSGPRSWWAGQSGFDRGCFLGLAGFVGVSALALMFYAETATSMVRHIQNVLGGECPEDLARRVFEFSKREVAWYVGYLALSGSLVFSVVRGWLGRNRAWLAWVCLGVLLAADLARANTPWIVHYDYRYRYAANPVLEVLRQKPIGPRVQCLHFNPNSLPRPAGQALGRLQDVYDEWKQHGMQMSRIPTLDVIQEPRPAEDTKMYRGLFDPRPPLWPRFWELTGTRYLLGLSGGFISSLNEQLDAGSNRFKLDTAFALEPKQDAPPLARGMDYTTPIRPDGPYAIIEFTGALPRAQLYSQWQVETNRTNALLRISEPAFDPHRTVVVAEELKATPSATNRPAGTVEIVSYQPKTVQLSARAETTVILLLNDKYDPDWKVRVDGRPEPLLRCNFLMRGVLLQPGRHQVVFRYEPRTTALWITLAALGVSGVLLAVVVFSRGGRARTSAADT